MSASTTPEQEWEVVGKAESVPDTKPATAVGKNANDTARLRAQAGDLEVPSTSLLQQSARKVLQRRST